MSTANDIAQLGKRIAATHGWAAARAFKSYEMDDPDRASLSQCAIDLLRIFPSLPNASALMSAALAVSLERQIDAPIFTVAGTLLVEGSPAFGSGQPFDGPQIFGNANPDFDGHVWLMVGTYVVDISIFRTAYSSQAPAILAKHIDLFFGPNKGVYVDHWKRTRQQGLHYEPHYVLSADEVTNLMGGAFHAIRQAQSE